MLTHAQRVRRAAEDALVGRGLHEIVGWSFTEPALLDRLLLPPDDHAMRRVVRLENPLSDAQSIMRPTLLGSLLDAARHNVARNGPDVAIFESGTVYRAGRGLRRRSPGRRAPRAGRAAERRAGAALVARRAGEADFFAAKALLGGAARPIPRALVGAGGAAGRSCTPGAAPRCSPAGSRLGFLGEVHPLVAGGVGPRAHGRLRARPRQARRGGARRSSPSAPFGPFPALRQDLAVTLPDEVSARELLHLVRKAGGEMLDKAEIFDVYTGDQVGEGRRSLALALSFRALERTLTDEDVAPVRERIVAALGELGGELRG